MSHQEREEPAGLAGEKGTANLTGAGRGDWGGTLHYEHSWGYSFY